MNLLLRIVSGAVLLAVIVAALWLGTAAVAALVGLTVVVGSYELRGLLAKMGLPPPVWILYPLSLWLAIRLALPAAYQDAQWPLLAALTAGLLAAVALKTGFDRWAAAVGASVYLGFGLGFFLALYLWPSTGEHFGLRLVLLVILASIAGDTAAYFTGRAVGRHRFFASISPHKTVEGAIGGAVATILVVALAGPALVGIGTAAGAGLGALITIAAQGGDLAESAVKRQAGEKDSSHLIPGHGGLLDRVDSLVLVAPVAYCYLRLIAF
ncbi:MAG: phosphatidate cytidylyltransferase [Candidatus Dormibacteria bacterium]